MCFSPAASFTAGSALTVIGIMTLRKTKTPREWPLASLPLLFAAQQFVEGLLWLVLLEGKSGAEQYWLTQIYTAFAGILWPLLIPLGIFLIESDNRRKRFLLAIFLISIGLAVYTLSIIARFGFHAEIFNACILYSHPAEQGLHMLALYIVTTCGAFFCSSERAIIWIGLANILALLAASNFYWTNFVSVWCFFSAFVSGLIYLYFSHKNQAEKSHS